MSEVMRFLAWDPRDVTQTIMAVPASDYDALARQLEEGMKRWAELCLDLSSLQQRLADAQKGSERYEKLRRWMSSNVAEGWSEVEKLAAAACYVGWDAFDTQLDSLPVCNVGLCEVAGK